MILIGSYTTFVSLCPLRIQLGLVTLTDGKSSPLAKGSRAGLARVRKFFDQSACIGNLAISIGRQEHEVQTSLCEYDKYCAWTLNERPIRRRRIVWNFICKVFCMTPWPHTHNEDELGVEQFCAIHDWNCNLYRITQSITWDRKVLVTQKFVLHFETLAGDSSCEFGVPFQGTPQVHLGIPQVNFGGPPNLENLCKKSNLNSKA